jgi:probable HAF family extracellular repeat protein
MRRFLAVCASAAFLCTWTPGIAASQTFTYTTIDAPGARNTTALGINDRSQIVGSFDNGATDYHGFQRSNGQFTIIDGPGATFTTPAGINNKGQIVGGYVIGDRMHGFLLDRGQFTTIDPPGSTNSTALSINDAGQIVGQYLDATGAQHGFLWTHGRFVTVDVAGSAEGRGLFGINRSGQVVGRYGDASGRLHGFRLEPGGAGITVDVAPGSFTQPNAISERGEIVGEASNSRGFLLSFGRLATVNVAGSQTTLPIGVNRRGQIVGRYVDGTAGNFRERGFIATPIGVEEDISASASPSGTRVPETMIIIDRDLTQWALGPGGEILHNGVQAANGYGSRILYRLGEIYVLGDDNNWWQWTNGTWTSVGPGDPGL